MRRALAVLGFTLVVAAFGTYAATQISIGILSGTEADWVSVGEQVESQSDVEITLHPASEFSLRFTLPYSLRHLSLLRESWVNSYGRYFQDLSSLEGVLLAGGASFVYYGGTPIGVRLSFDPGWFVGVQRWPDDPSAVSTLLALAAGIEDVQPSVTPTGRASPTRGAKPSSEQHRRNVDGSLSALLADVEASLGQAITSVMSFLPSSARRALERSAARYGIPLTTAPNGETAVTVVVEVRGSSTATAQQVRAMGVANQAIETSTASGLVRVEVPLSQFDSFLATIAGSGYIRPPYIPYATAVTGEGVAAIGAEAFHTAGLRGAGVKIAIIDLGFSGLSQSQANGDLPLGVVSNDFTGSGLQTGISHGTAVAEIVHEIAPDAELHLIKIADEVDLDQAISYCISSGIHVANHSLGWYNTNFYDGQGMVASIARRAINHGILWVNSAGNEAQRHWDGVYADGNGDGWNDTDITLTAIGGRSIGIYLTWNEWPAASTDFDLYLYDPAGGLVGSSTKYQTGIEEP
ncbi:MAG: S8 family serine peptidase, partial [Candidatus Bipolaricaulota bacterium]